MQTRNSKTYRCAVLLFVIETVLPFVLLSLKMWAVNTTLLEIGSFTPAMVAFSLVLVGMVCCLIRFGLRRSHVPFLWIVYSFISVVLMVDVVYSGYTNKLPSAVMLQYTGQLGDVSDAILENVTFGRILYAIDIPLWIVYFLYLHPKLTSPVKADLDGPRTRKNRLVLPRFSGIFLPALTGAAACVCAGYCMFTAFVPAYFKNEIISYHVLDIAALLTGNQTQGAFPGDIIKLPDGLSSDIIPVMAETSPYYGIAKGRNVITVQVEALQNFVIGTYYNGQELTPNLNRMIAEDTLYFDHYYYQIGGGNTADAEFAVNNSLYAPDTEAAYSKYPQNDYYSMATLLKDNGYTTATAYHGYIADYWSRSTAYPGQGFDAFLSGDHYYYEPKEKAGLGVSDAEFFTKAVEHMKTQESPFYAFLVTLSSHYPYEIDPRYYSLTMLPEDEGTLYGNYLQSIHYVDQAFGILIDALKEA